MPNINIELPNDLHRILKIEAAKQELSLKDLVIGILDGNAGKKVKKQTGEST